MDIDEYHCARCGRRSNMYGHTLAEGWYCETLPGMTDAIRERCAEFDRRSAERSATLAAAVEKEKRQSANVIICPHCHVSFGEEAATFEAVNEPQRVGQPARFKVKHTDTNCGHEFVASHRDFFPRGGRPAAPRNPFDPVRWTL